MVEILIPNEGINQKISQTEIWKYLCPVGYTFFNLSFILWAA